MLHVVLVRTPFQIGNIVILLVAVLVWLGRELYITLPESPLNINSIVFPYTSMNPWDYIKYNSIVVTA